MMYDVVTNGIPMITTEYHSLTFSTIGPFNYILGLSGTLNGNLKYHPIPLNGTRNPKYHSKTIQIPFKYPWPYKPLVPFNGIFLRGASNRIYFLSKTTDIYIF